MSCISSNDSKCANCGKGEETSISLKSCTACKMVKYCNRECQIAHRPQHKKECRKRVAELHDEELFKQPPLMRGDCPICFLRLPQLNSGWQYQSCCGKIICMGCNYAPVYDNQGNELDNEKCPYCRTLHPTTNGEIIERRMKLIEKDNAMAIYNQGNWYFNGRNGFTQDYANALEYWHRAGELGHAEAYNNIGHAYDYGKGLEMDKKKAKHYYELAAMRGNEMARHNLGIIEKKAGNIDRALKHFLIAVRSGHSDSLERIKQMYTYGYVTKDDYTKALQLYQAYLGAIKSKQRDKAAAADEKYRYY